MSDRPGTRSRSRRLGGITSVALVLTVLIAVAGLVGLGVTKLSSNSGVDLETLPRAVVKRTDLFVKLKAPGQVESVKRTVIECEIENMQFRSHGQQLDAGGSSMIVSIIPEGTRVQKGDVLAQLDSSDYEELVRQQEIKVQEEVSDTLEDKLRFESAEKALVEYRDGLLEQQKEQFEGQITLARADVQRQTERVSWSKKMTALGYVPESQLVNEERSLLSMQINLRTARDSLKKLLEYESPKKLMELGFAVENAKTDFLFQERRLRIHKERLEHFQRQVELCTIRAPHPGFVIYANDDDDDPRIEPGITVRQHMDLFYLPDLDDMEVETTLHESVIDRVRKGMTARIKVEALPQYQIEGELVKIEPLPEPGNWRTEIKNFIGHVKLHSVPQGLLPGMSAEVEIVTASHPGALVIPPGAMAIEDGEEICYVVSPGKGLERRQVKVGEQTLNELEVTEGLDEGEEVVLDPTESLANVPGAIPPGNRHRPIEESFDDLEELTH